MTAMASALADVEFLARSEHRLAILQALHDAPRTRDELRDLTDASRTTLSRLLADFEDRGWVGRSNDRYVPTPEGTYVAGEVSRLLDNLETAAELDGLLQWLPTGAFTFDLHRLRDAEVVTLRWNDPASMRLLAEQLEGVDQVRSMADTVSREVVDVLRDLTVGGDGTYEGVLSSEAVEVIRAHPELAGQLREMLESGRATLYRYDGVEVESMLLCFDDVVALCNHAKGGPRVEGLVSEDPVVRAWAKAYFDAVRDRAIRLDVEAFVA